MMIGRILRILSVCACGCALARRRIGRPFTLRMPRRHPASSSRTHSAREKLGSLLESTGAGCVWFDYNNDGKPDLFVASGRPLGKDMHPYPLRNTPDPLPHNHLYRNDGNGKFTDVTRQAGVGGDGFSFAPWPPISITTASPICWSPATAT